MSITSEKSSIAELTICTVSFYHQGHLKLNLNLTETLNSRNQCRWIVVENTPNGGRMILDQEVENGLILKGSPRENFQTPNEHHAAGLNKALECVDTRFVLISDPDFYIICPNWIENVLSYMKTNDLSFFGVPWHPKWYMKYRYFPCIHCLFVDLEKVPMSTLDFMPDFVPLRFGSAQRGMERSSFIAELQNNIPPIFRRGIKFLKCLTVERRHIGWDGDTGSRFYVRFHQKDGYHYECVIPVFRPQWDLQVPIPWRLNRRIERILPDCLSYIPKRPGYFSKSGFLDDETMTSQWEEFLWKHQLFGFHVRGYPKRKDRDMDMEIEKIERALENLMKHTPI